MTDSDEHERTIEMIRRCMLHQTVDIVVPHDCGNRGSEVVPSGPHVPVELTGVVAGYHPLPFETAYP